jgi:hypothetical protein
MLRLFLLCVSLFVGLGVYLRAGVNVMVMPIQTTLSDFEVSSRWWQMLTAKKTLKTKIKFKNTSTSDIWVCVLRDFQHRYDYNVRGSTLEIRFVGHAFKKGDILLDEYLKSVFQKIEPGGAIDQQVEILFPIKNKKVSHLNDIRQINIEIGYYAAHEIINNPDCCERLAAINQVRVDPFWMYENPSKTIVERYSFKFYAKDKGDADSGFLILKQGENER